MCSIIIISNAESYEWTVVNSLETVETNSNVSDELAGIDKSQKDNIDELNLECESAILIEQNSGQVKNKSSGMD